MTVKLRLTHHSIERYQARYCPGLAFTAAASRLRELAEQAVPTNERTVQDRHEVWLARDGDVEVRFAVKRDRGARMPPVAVTVLPPDVAKGGKRARAALATSSVRDEIKATYRALNHARDQRAYSQSQGAKPDTMARWDQRVEELEAKLADLNAREEDEIL